MTAIVWGEVLRLPALLMREARDLREQAPVKAALRAAARRRDRDPDHRSGPARQPRPDQARGEPDPAGRPALTLLARVPELRRQEPGQARVRPQGAPDQAHRGVCARSPAGAPARLERALALPGRERSPQELTTLGDQITDSVEDRVGIRVTAAPVPPCGGGPDPASHAGLRARAPGARPQAIFSTTIELLCRA